MSDAQSMRLKTGGRIDRDKPLSFTFDGKQYGGFKGDTLASALLANGVRVVGRSFKYHRPRGILAAGAEECNALVTVGQGALEEPQCTGDIAAVVRWPGGAQPELLALCKIRYRAQS